MSQQHDFGRELGLPAGPVSIVADSDDGLRQVACLLARDQVGLARMWRVAAPPPGQPSAAPAFQRALQAVQADAETEIIVLVADALPSEAVGRLLEQVRRSDKPTVACFLGSDPRLAWRAGAIPARRLDEAAMRATAWVRGWDQALVSSRLEEQRDQLAALAGELRARVGPGRRQIRGLFPGDALRREASLVLARALGSEVAAGWLQTFAGASGLGPHLNEVLAAPGIAVVLLSLVLADAARPDSTRDLLAALQGPSGRGPVCIAHVSGDAGESARLAEIEAGLRREGVVVAPSNAAAALLAGLLVESLAGGE